MQRTRVAFLDIPQRSSWTAVVKVDDSGVARGAPSANVAVYPICCSVRLAIIYTMHAHAQSA